MTELVPATELVTATKLLIVTELKMKELVVVTELETGGVGKCSKIGGSIELAFVAVLELALEFATESMILMAAGMLELVG